MQILNRSNKWILISILRFCTILIIVAQLNFEPLAKILMGGSLFLLATIAGGVTHGLGILFASLGVVTTFQIVIERVFSSFILPLSIHSMFIFLVAIAMIALSKPAQSVLEIEFRFVFFEFLSVLVSTFLLRELMVSGGVELLTLLKPEDNIPWISRANYLLVNSEISGAVSDGGGHAFSHVLALIAQLKNIGASSGETIVASLETIVISYQLLGIFGLLFIGYFSLNMLSQFKYSSVVAAISTQILAFKLLYPLVATEGHLTLLMAITFCWLFLYLSDYLVKSLSKYNLIILVSIASLIAGAWWPLLPVSIFAIGVLLHRFYYSQVIGSIWIRRSIPYIVIVLSIAAFFPLYKDLFRTLDFRSFLMAGGTFTESQPLMTAAAVGGLYLLYTTYKLINVETNNWVIMLSVPGLMLIYGISLSQATFFVGPNFSQSNYSAGKLLYAGVAVTLPVIIPAGALKLASTAKTNVGVGALLLLSIMGSAFFGNNVLNGRFNNIESAWSETFLIEARRSPDAIIVCNGENDFEAYLCTKTSRYIMPSADLGGFRGKWGDFQLSPVSGTSLRDALELTLSDNPGSQIIIISLEPSLTIQDVDREQFSLLPWSQIKIIDAKSGKKIDYSGL
jgi:hypothetical protein